MPPSSLAHFLALSLLFCISISGAYGARSPPDQGLNARLSAPRKKVSIEGTVYCTFCVMEGGPGSVIKRALLPGAVVKLACNNTNKGWEVEKRTSKKGRFVIKPQKLTTFGAHKCKVFLVSSPRPDCPILDYPDDREATLRPAPTNTTSDYQHYTVGPFGFHPGPYMCV